MLTVKVCKQTQTETDIQTDEQISDIMQTVIPFRSMIMVKEEKKKKQEKPNIPHITYGQFILSSTAFIQSDQNLRLIYRIYELNMCALNNRQEDFLLLIRNRKILKDTTNEKGEKQPDVLKCP